MKMVVISNGPLPYHTPILNALSDRLPIHVIYMSSGHPLGSFRDLWGETPRFAHSTFWSLPVRWRWVDFRAQLSIGVCARLSRLRPDVILFSSWGPLVWEPLLWKYLRGAKAVMWAESTATSGLLRGAVSDLLRRRVVAAVDAFVSNGTKATEYLMELGASPERIVTSCLPSRLAGRSGVCTANPGPRRDGTAVRYLFVGRLIPRKRILELLAIFPEVRRAVPEAILTVVGDGPLYSEVERAATSLEGAVRLCGRLEGRDLAEVYAQSDILVLPAMREVWGLVVNEALASGLYVVASDQVGSAYDLLDEQSGTVVPVSDVAALQSALIQAAYRVRQPGFSRAALAERIRKCTPEKFADDVLRAAAIATHERWERHEHN